MTPSPKQTAPGEATVTPHWDALDDAEKVRLMTRARDSLGRECDAQLVQITSLRAALTEAVDSAEGAAKSCTILGHETTDETARVYFQRHAASLRAKAEAWRKVLTDSEVTNAR